MTDNALKFYINGEWVDPVTPKTLDVINPATEKPMGQISLGSAADVDKAVAAAKAAFESFSQTSREERIGYLEKILAGYKKRWVEIGTAISQEMGAPMAFAQGSQAGAGYSHFNNVLEALKTYEFESELGNTQLRHEPIGVCGLITPWNWPMNQIAQKVGPAIA